MAEGAFNVPGARGEGQLSTFESQVIQKDVSSLPHINPRSRRLTRPSPSSSMARLSTSAPVRPSKLRPLARRASSLFRSRAVRLCPETRSKRYVVVNLLWPPASTQTIVSAQHYAEPRQTQPRLAPALRPADPGLQRSQPSRCGVAGRGHSGRSQRARRGSSREHEARE